MSASDLPADVLINPGAGRGALLFVPVRLESGEEMPFVLDTGSSGTLLDESLVSKLGDRVGTMSMQMWGKVTEHPTYASPRLFLGGAPLKTGRAITAFNCRQWRSDDGRPAMGMLSFDCLKHYCVQFDFQAGKMRFLDPARLDHKKLGKAFPITLRGGRPFVLHSGLVEGKGTNTLIDTGYSTDGAIRELPFKNSYVAERVWEDNRYANLVLGNGGYVLGLRFLARHLVTLDFPNETMYLRRQSAGPLPGDKVSILKTTRIEGLDALLKAVLREDPEAAQSELLALEKSGAPEPTKTIARKLVGTMRDEPKPSPAGVPPNVTELPLGDAQPQVAQVGWLKPAANRFPRNDYVDSPLLDSGKIYATGLYAHSPSWYVYDLGGRWKKLRGEAGLHTTHQPYAAGVVFVIKTDGKEVFRSRTIRGATKAGYRLDVTGVKTLELIVENASDRNTHNWSLWLGPTLFR